MESMTGSELSLKRALTRKLVAPIADERGHKLSRVRGTNHRKHEKSQQATVVKYEALVE